MWGRNQGNTWVFSVSNWVNDGTTYKEGRRQREKQVSVWGGGGGIDLDLAHMVQ